MNLFGRIRRRKADPAEQTGQSVGMEEIPAARQEEAEAMPEDKEDRTGYLKENCEQVIEAVRQIEEAKIEYQAVTSYLADMQKIDMAGADERQVMEDAARRIITLTRERSRYQSREVKITDRQQRSMEKYEPDMVKAIKQMRDNESYSLSVKNDLRHLEGEKGSLKHQKKEIIEKQKYLKKLSVITFVLVGILFLLFIAISYVFKTNMTIPFVLTIIMAAASAFYIFHESGKNHIDIQLVEKKLNKAISLLNKVKIKYVNNTNALDYSYEKYGVHSSAQLQYLWEQYLKAKEAESKYRQNTDMLNRYNEILIEEMRKLKTADPEIWIYQAAAILDQREMVEIRHRLNVRRQKLRERIEYNTRLKEDSVNRMQEAMEEAPGIREEVIELLKQYNITLD